MKKLLFMLFILPLWCFAQTNIAPQFKRNIPADSLLGYSIPGIIGNHWLADTVWIKKHGGHDLVAKATDFEGAGTTSDKFGLRDTLLKTNWIIKYGLRVGDGTDTTRRYYEINRKLGSTPTTVRFALSALNGGGPLLYNTANGWGLGFGASRNWPYITFDGITTYPVATTFLPIVTGVIDSFVVVKNGEFGYQAGSGGGVTIPQVDSIALAKADSVKATVATIYTQDGTVITGGGFRNIDLNDNEIDWIGHYPSNDVYTKMYPSGNIAIRAAAGQSDNNYGLYVPNPGTSGFANFGGGLIIDGSANAFTTRPSLHDSTGRIPTTAWVRTELSGAGGGTTTNALTMNNSGSGASSGTTFDGSTARTISYNTIGAVPQGLTIASHALTTSNVTLGTLGYVYGVNVFSGSSTYDGSTGSTFKVDSTVIKTKASALADYNNLVTAIGAKGTGTVTSITPGYGHTSSTPITTSGTITIDTTLIRAVANSRSLAQTQTALNLKANIASPTFTGTVTIPNGGVFGTPTSMTATNVTGLPLTTGVTGVLPNANTTATAANTASSIVTRDANGNFLTNSATQGFATTANAGGTTTLTISSAPNQHFTGTTANQTVVLPVASTLPQGYVISISNDCTSTGVVTVQSSGANTIFAQPGFSTINYTCILTSGTGIASWQASYQLGISSPGSNANTVVQPSGTGLITFATAATVGFRSRSSSSLDFWAGATAEYVISNNGILFRNGFPVTWSTSDPTSVGGDIGLIRTTTGSLDVNDGSTAGGAGHFGSLRTKNLTANGTFTFINPTTGTAATDSVVVHTSAGQAKVISPMYYAATLPIVGTPTIVAGTGAGTSPTVSVTSNGKQLQVTVTTGTLPTGTNATVATVTLANALPYTPYPIFSSANANTALLSGASMIYMTSTGTTNVTITSGTTALTAATTYLWNVDL